MYIIIIKLTKSLKRISIYRSLYYTVSHASLPNPLVNCRLHSILNFFYCLVTEFVNFVTRKILYIMTVGKFRFFLDISKCANFVFHKWFLLFFRHSHFILLAVVRVFFTFLLSVQFQKKFKSENQIWIWHVVC